MDFDKILCDIYENYDVDENRIEELLTTLEFRYDKNHYHYDNIKRICSSANPDDNKKILYFELENMLINIRSTVDSVLHLVNFIYKMNINEELTFSLIKKNQKCPQSLNELFGLYTNSRNKIWNFIYLTRNDIVHEVCIKTKLPIVVDEIYADGAAFKKVFFIDKYGSKESVLFYYKECIDYIDDFLDKILYRISKNYR